MTVTGTPSKSSKTTIAARSISVTTASSTGSCTGQFRAGGAGGAGGSARGPAASGGGCGGFGRGGEGGTTGGTRPTFKAGSGRGFRRRRNIAIATGKVTGVSGSTVKVTGYAITPGSFGRNATVQLQDEEAGDTQDREPHDHDDELHDRRSDPDGRRDGPGGR